MASSDDRSNKDGSAPIHLIYQIQGQRRYYAVPDTKLFPVNWDPVNQQAIYVDKKSAKRLAPGMSFESLFTSSEVAEINTKLERVMSDVADVETRFKLDKKAFDVDMVIDKLKELKNPETKKAQPGINLVDFIHRFVKDSAGTHKPGTLKVYTGLAAHLSDFEKAKRIKITFGNIDIPLLRAFNSFLSEVSHKTTSKGKKVEKSRNKCYSSKTNKHAKNSSKLRSDYLQDPGKSRLQGF